MYINHNNKSSRYSISIYLNVSILLGNGDDTFSTAVNYAVGEDGPGPIVIGDFN
jgi:hypothetical protein